MVAPAETVRILVVDDERQIAELLTGILREEGHDAECVTRPEAALERLRADRYDLLVTDLRMPGMDGMELIAEAQQLDPGLGTLVMTAYSSTETAVDALRRGVTDYLSKPFGVDDIREVLGKFLRARGRRREERAHVETLSAQVRTAQQSLESKVADLTLLHDLTRLIADRDAPLVECLERLAEHFQAELVLLTEEDRVLARCGQGPETGLRSLARRAHAEGTAMIMPGAMAAPVGRGAVVVWGGEFDQEHLRVLAITASDLSLAAENDRLRAEQRGAYLGIVTTLIEAVEAKDRFNRGHSRRVADLAVRFGARLGLAERDLDLLGTGAKLHDIGKIGIPEAILNKNGKLTDEEFDAIKSHPVLAEPLLQPLDFLAEARPIVRHHHERWDGRGYPDGLVGDAIPHLAAMLSIVDAYDALTSDRPYRAGMPPDEALGILRSGAGTQWAPDLVDAFVAM